MFTCERQTWTKAEPAASEVARVGPTPFVSADPSEPIFIDWSRSKHKTLCHGVYRLWKSFDAENVRSKQTLVIRPINQEHPTDLGQKISIRALILNKPTDLEIPCNRLLFSFGCKGQRIDPDESVG